MATTTSLPFDLNGNTSLHMRIPVVSLSLPPLQSKIFLLLSKKIENIVEPPKIHRECATLRQYVLYRFVLKLVSQCPTFNELA